VNKEEPQKDFIKHNFSKETAVGGNNFGSWD
jgi:hypothetical protein